MTKPLFHWAEGFLSFQSWVGKKASSKDTRASVYVSQKGRASVYVSQKCIPHYFTSTLFCCHEDSIWPDKLSVTHLNGKSEFARRMWFLCEVAVDANSLE